MYHCVAGLSSFPYHGRAMAGETPSLTQMARRGVELCRDGRWPEGLNMLAEVFNSKSGSSGELPGSYLSYLGYGIARFHNQKKEGLALCEQAVKTEFYQVDSFFNLARTAALLGEKRKAMKALERGLKLDPQHAPSLALVAELGTRRSPVLSFLPRGHALNRWLGKIRHDIKATPPAKSETGE